MPKPPFKPAPEYCIEDIRTLLKKGPTKNDLTNALCAAANEGQTDIVQQLLAHGADMYECHSTGYSYSNAFYNAVDGDHLDVVRIMLDHEKTQGHRSVKEAIINEENGDGETPLFKACEGRDIALVQYLLENDADVNHKDCNGQTAIHHVIEQMHGGPNNRVQIAELLLQAGADVNNQDQCGATILANIKNEIAYNRKFLLKCKLSFKHRHVWSNIEDEIKILKALRRLFQSKRGIAIKAKKADLNLGEDARQDLTKLKSILNNSLNAYRFIRKVEMNGFAVDNEDEMGIQMKSEKGAWLMFAVFPSIHRKNIATLTYHGPSSTDSIICLVDEGKRMYKKWSKGFQLK